MTKRLFVLFFIATLLLSACQAAATLAPTPTPVPPTPTPIPPTETPTVPVLELVDVDGTAISLTMDDLKALPATSGQGGIKSSTGRITLPAPYVGVALKDLITLLPVFDATMGVSVEAVDGYAITFSYDQIMGSTFIQYDPGTGDELKTTVPLTAMLAYEVDGHAFDPVQDGNLRLAIVSFEPRQVVDGHWSVKFVNKVIVKSLGEEWFLELEGAVSETMDRATFESGSSPDCHAAAWTDEKAQAWVGIPLWLMVGRVDDEIKHEGPAYNDALADMGYTVDVIASDGYTVSFDSARLKRNNDILLAYEVNDTPLPDKYYPLRLVGNGLEKSEMVGMIVKIVVHVEGMVAPTVEPTPQPVVMPADGELLITGLVANPLTVPEENLRALEVVQITAEHPKKGPQDYEGVRLNSLLQLAGVDAAATKLVLTAGDGYTAEVFLAEVTACADCLVAFTDTPGEFFLVMPGLPSGVWVKDIALIDVQ